MRVNMNKTKVMISGEPTQASITMCEKCLMNV